MSMETPGIYPGVPYSAYAKVDAINHSTLRHFSRSAAHAHHERSNPRHTPEMKLGSAVHVAVLEPDDFMARYIAAPKIDKRTKVGKAEWANFKEINKAKLFLDPSEWDLCLSLRDAVHRHPMAQTLLAPPGANELSLLWDDAETGLRCKGRLDRLTAYDGWPFIVDLKTAQDASRDAFSRQLHNLRYYEQAALYLDGADAIAPSERRYAFIVAEKAPPYAVAVYELEADALELGRDNVRRHLQEYAECRRTNEWPAYSDDMEPISVPHWAFRAKEAEAA